MRPRMEVIDAREALQRGADGQRRELLDVVDRLLEVGAYGTAEAIDELHR